MDHSTSPRQSDDEPINSLIRTTDPVAPDELWRTFVAVQLPRRVQLSLSGLVERMPSRQRRFIQTVSPGGMHLTLKFVGGIEPARTTEIAHLLEGAAKQSGRFELELGETGVFPSPSRPGALWAGFKGEVQRLIRLQARVEGAMTVFGITPDRRRYHPHTTVARLRRDARGRMAVAIGEAWLASSPRAVSFPIKEFALFRSHLGPRGARYERLFTTPLA